MNITFTKKARNRRTNGEICSNITSHSNIEGQRSVRRKKEHDENCKGNEEGGGRKQKNARNGEGRVEMWNEEDLHFEVGPATVAFRSTTADATS
jgi:hypothetical protein